MNTFIESKNLNVDALIAVGMSPSHEQIAPIVTMCQSVITTPLKANFPCNVANAEGQQVPTTCVQSYAKAVNGKWVPASRDDFLRAAANNESVNIADFETQAAQNVRLAEAAAKEEEGRRRFAVSPEGKRQAELLSPNANWIARRVGGPPQYYDGNSVNSGPAWTNYRTVVVYRQSEDVNGKKITSDFRITDTAVECSGVQERYVLFIKTYYFEGKFDPQNLRATALGARMTAQDTEPSAFSNAAWQGEINTMCRSKAAQTGFVLNEDQKKAVARARTFNGPRLAKEREEARRRPRGYMVACSGTKNSELNLYFVNCDNPASVRDGFRWAYNRLLVERSDGRHFASGCLENLRKYSGFPASVASNRQVINGSLAACNVGLQYVQGPSVAEAAVRKR